MARGWESKDVASRQEEAWEARSKPQASADEIARRSRLHSLELDKVRLERELDASRNPRHSAMVQSALDHILAEMAKYQ